MGTLEATAEAARKMYEYKYRCSLSTLSPSTEHALEAPHQKEHDAGDGAGGVKELLVSEIRVDGGNDDIA